MNQPRGVNALEDENSVMKCLILFLFIPSLSVARLSNALVLFLRQFFFSSILSGTPRRGFFPSKKKIRLYPPQKKSYYGTKDLSNNREILLFAETGAIL